MARRALARAFVRRNAAAVLLAGYWVVNDRGAGRVMLEVGIGVGWAYVETCRLRGVGLRLGGVGGEAYGRVAVIELGWVCSW